MKYLQRQILQVKKENHLEFWKIHFFNSSMYKGEKLFIRLIELKGLYSMWNEMNRQSQHNIIIIVVVIWQQK